MTRLRFALFICACLALRALALSPQAALEKAGDLELRGQFKQAAEVLTAAQKDSSLPAGERRRIAFELDRLDRIRKDFPLTEDDLFSALQKSVRGLTRTEFDAWVQEKRFDSRDIDGRRYFMVSSVSNLFFRYPELVSRRNPPRDETKLDHDTLDCVRAITQAARAAKKPYVLPKRFRASMTVTAAADAAPDGETISAWLPIPRLYPFQTDFELLSTSSPVKHLDDESSPIRSVELEQPARKGQPTRFQIQYAYTIQGVQFGLDPAATQPLSAEAKRELAPYLAEAPHVVFTPEIRELSRQIAGTETNLCVKARKFYDWIADHILYSYAIEYSTIRNISDYCRSRGYGDCGQEALLFITLCRLNGIPARWQSGWNTFPGGKTIHDWSEIYLAPYGWVPVDPYMGIYAARYATSLTPAERQEIRDFYFGGLDQYRMAANMDHCQQLKPPKRSMRSDTVDFQRGELEWGDHNIYFDHYSFDLKIEELQPKP